MTEKPPKSAKKKKLKPVIRVDGANRRDKGRVDLIRSRFEQTVHRNRDFVERKKDVVTTTTQKKKEKQAKKVKDQPKIQTPQVWEDRVADGMFVRIVKRTSPLRRIMAQLDLSDGVWLERFQADFEIVNSGIKAAPMEVAVQGGQSPGIPLVRLEAQERIRDCAAEVGASGFQIALAVVFSGLTPVLFAHRSGLANVVAKDRIRVAMNAVKGFYENVKTRPSRSGRMADEVIRQFGADMR